MLQYLHDEDKFLAKMAIIYCQFESIHPFYDGNGRTGRIINILYLILTQYLDIPILYLSSYIIKNKAEYYRLRRSATSQEQWEEWIIYILKGIEVVEKETIHKILKITKLLGNTIEKVKPNY